MIDNQAMQDLVPAWVAAMGRADAGTPGVLLSFAWRGFTSWAAPRLKVKVGALSASKGGQEAFMAAMEVVCPGSHANGSMRYPLLKWR